MTNYITHKTQHCNNDCNLNKIATNSKIVAKMNTLFASNNCFEM